MFKKFLESKGFTAETFKTLEAEKQADLQNEYLGTLETQIEALKGNTTEIESLKTTITELKGADKTSDLTTKLNDLAGEIQLKVNELSNAFTGLGAIIGKAFDNPQLGSFLGQFTQFVAKIVVGAFAVAKANAIAGATQSSLFTGPAAAFTLPAFIAGAVGLVASAFAGIKGAGGGSGGGSVGAGVSGQSFGGTGLNAMSNINIGGEFMVKGSDLIFVLSQEEKKRKNG